MNSSVKSEFITKFSVTNFIDLSSITKAVKRDKYYTVSQLYWKRKLSLLELSVLYKIALDRKKGNMKMEEKERAYERERARERDNAASGVGDFIKNSYVWELLSEPSLPDQGLCCQPSS